DYNSCESSNAKAFIQFRSNGSIIHTRGLQLGLVDYVQPDQWDCLREPMGSKLCAFVANMKRTFDNVCQIRKIDARTFTTTFLAGEDGQYMDSLGALLLDDLLYQRDFLSDCLDP